MNRRLPSRRASQHINEAVRRHIAHISRCGSPPSPALEYTALLHTRLHGTEVSPEPRPPDGRCEAAGTARLEGGEAPPHVHHRAAGPLDREERGREQRDARHVDSAEVAQLVRVRVRVRVWVWVRVWVRVRVRVRVRGWVRVRVRVWVRV